MLFSLFCSGLHSISNVIIRKRKEKTSATASYGDWFCCLASATLNAAFFPAGDVLLLFAVVGLVLFLVRKWSDKAILITAIILLIQPIEWYHYIMSLLNPAHALPDLGVGAMYSEVAEYTKAGNFLDFIWGNITLGQKASLYWAIGAGRFLQTAGLFLVGLYIGRKELFVTSETHLRFWVKVLIIAAICFAPLYSLKEQIMASDNALIKQTVGDSFRHVAEICVYIHPRFLVCTLIPERMLQESCFSSAFLR